MNSFFQELLAKSVKRNNWANIAQAPTAALRLAGKNSSFHLKKPLCECMQPARGGGCKMGINEVSLPVCSKKPLGNISPLPWLTHGAWGWGAVPGVWLVVLWCSRPC